LQAATSHRTDQSLQKSVSVQPKKEFQNIFSNASKKIKHPTHSPTNKHSKNDTNGRHKNGCTHDRQERQPITAPTRNWRFSASYDSFVVIQTLVLRMNILGNNRQLLVAANRYKQA